MKVYMKVLMVCFVFLMSFTVFALTYKPQGVCRTYQAVVFESPCVSCPERCEEFGYEEHLEAEGKCVCYGIRGGEITVSGLTEPIRNKEAIAGTQRGIVERPLPEAVYYRMASEWSGYETIQKGD